jgi:hypothetical protein
MREGRVFWGERVETVKEIVVGVGREMRRLWGGVCILISSNLDKNRSIGVGNVWGLGVALDFICGLMWFSVVTRLAQYLRHL